MVTMFIHLLKNGIVKSLIYNLLLIIPGSLLIVSFNSIIIYNTKQAVVLDIQKNWQICLKVNHFLVKHQ